MIGNMYNACLFIVIVSAEIIVFGFRTKIRGCLPCIFMFRNIGISVIINAVKRSKTVVVRNWIRRYRTFIMETNVIYVFRKENIKSNKSLSFLYINVCYC